MFWNLYLKTLFHITHLIEKAKSQGMMIGVYPIDDNAWLDIGQWDEYQLERLSFYK